MVSTSPLISKSSSPFTNLLVIFPSTPTTITMVSPLTSCSIVYFWFSNKVWVFISLFTFFFFTLWLLGGPQNLMICHFCVDEFFTIWYMIFTHKKEYQFQKEKPIGDTKCSMKTSWFSQEL